MPAIASPPAMREILRTLGPDAQLKALSLTRYRQLSGHDLNGRLDVSAMAHAVTAAEDALEVRVRGASTELRQNLQRLRRRLENALP